MAGWNGSGTFTGPTYTWVNDLNAGIVITASRFDTNDTDYTAGVNACLAKNGENAATANLNIGGFRLTSVGTGTALTDAATVGQSQSSTAQYIAASGTNTIAAALSPAISAYANGQKFRVKIANTTTAAATMNFNSLGALNIYYADGTTQIVAGALIQNNIYDFEYNSSLNSAAGGFVVSNPSRVTGSFTGTATGFPATVPTCTITYRTTADFTNCTLIFGTGLSGTSNATTFTITGMPSFLTPAQTQSYYTTLEDNTTRATGSITFTAASAVITLGNSASIGVTGGFTASGTKGFANGSIPGQNIAVTFVVN